MAKVLTWLKKKPSEFDSIPEKTGVYLITCTCTDKADWVVYSGQSIDLRARTKQHWSDSELNVDLKKAIKNYPGAFAIYYAESNEDDVDGIERYLFNTYSPQFSDKAPDVEPKAVTLPNVKKGKVNFKAK